MWHPALLKTLIDLEFPLPRLRWVFLLLQERTMSIHFGDAISRVINILSGAPQGS
ncbi:unnamed protein product, partial [Didymodactylos carnosus]